MAVTGMVTGGLSAVFSAFSSIVSTDTQLLVHKGVQAAINTLISVGSYMLQSAITGQDISGYGFIASVTSGFISGVFFDIPAYRSIILSIGLQIAGYGDSFIEMIKKVF